MLKRTFVLYIALVAAFSAQVRAESGLIYHASSSTLVGGLSSNVGTVLVLNSDVKISTTSGSKGIVFEDGSTMRSSLPVSSSTLMTGISVTNTVPADCLAGSTVTLVTDNVRAFSITLDGTLTHNTKDSTASFQPIINGAAPGLGGLNAYKTISFPAADVITGADMMFHTGPLPAGTHTFCIKMWTSIGTLSTPANYVLQHAVVGH